MLASQSTYIFVEFLGQHRAWDAEQFLRHAQGQVEGLPVVPPDYAVQKAAKSLVNPHSIDLAITNGGSIVKPEVIADYLHPQYREIAVGDFFPEITRNFHTITALCATETDAIKLIYLAVCCRLLNHDVAARLNADNSRAVDVLWPVKEPLGRLRRPGWNVEVQSFEPFTLIGANVQELTETWRTWNWVLQEIRARNIR